MRRLSLLRRPHRGADEGVLFDDLEQIGDQDGSNVGGLFQSKVDGQKFYVKAPDTELAAKSRF